VRGSDNRGQSSTSAAAFFPFERKEEEEEEEEMDEDDKDERFERLFGAVGEAGTGAKDETPSIGAGGAALIQPLG